MSFAPVLHAAAGLALLLAVAGCRGEGAPPNVLLVSVDTLRADAIAPYGGPAPTPAFDRLAAQGARFRHAIAPSAETAPSHATLLTGQEIPRHGVVENGVALPAEARTLAQALAERGYRTGAFVSSFVLDARFGWDRGFEAFDDAFPVAGETFHSRTVREGGFWQEHRYEGFDRRAFDTTRAARRWLEGIPEPFFLFVHYFDPHDPYVPPKVYRERGESLAIDLSDRKLTGPGGSALPTLVRHYHGEVMYVDDALGSLLDALDARGLADRTLVIVTADHGEGLGQHYWLNHLVYLYEEEVRVPWLVRLPGRVPAGLELATPVGLVDLAPTVAAFAGASLPDADGRSLAPALETGREPEPRPVLGMRQNLEKPYAGHLGDLQMWRTPRWKLLRGSVQQDELYDLDADPREQSNQIGARPDVFAELAAALDARLAQLPTHPAVAPLPDDVKRGLEALGYGTETPRPEKDR